MATIDNLDTSNLKITFATEEPTEVAENEIVFVYEE